MKERTEILYVKRAWIPQILEGCIRCLGWLIEPVTEIKMDKPGILEGEVTDFPTISSPPQRTTKKPKS